jgi:hypothetical protein
VQCRAVLLTPSFSDNVRSCACLIPIVNASLSIVPIPLSRPPFRYLSTPPSSLSPSYSLRPVLPNASLIISFPSRTTFSNPRSTNSLHHYTLEIDVDNLVQTHPQEDWIRFDPDLHRTSIQILATEAEPTAKVPARFIRFRVEPLTGEPTIYGTMGRGRPIYAECLEAAPASWAVPANYRDEGHFLLLTKERMIGGPLKRAIEDLGDYRVKADIMHLRSLEADKRKLALRLQEVQALEAYTQKRWAEFGMYQLAHIGRTKAV